VVNLLKINQSLLQ